MYNSPAAGFYQVIDKPFASIDSFQDQSMMIDIYEYICEIECDETMTAGTNTDLTLNYIDGYRGCQN